jgi:hypothetical protein
LQKNHCRKSKNGKVGTKLQVVSIQLSLCVCWANMYYKRISTLSLPREKPWVSWSFSLKPQIDHQSWWARNPRWREISFQPHRKRNYLKTTPARNVTINKDTKTPCNLPESEVAVTTSELCQEPFGKFMCFLVFFLSNGYSQLAEWESPRDIKGSTSPKLWSTNMFRLY